MSTTSQPVSLTFFLTLYCFFTLYHTLFNFGISSYCASEESLCGQELYDNTFKHPSVEAGEAYKRYIEKVKPVMVKQMAADYQIQFLNTYPEFPYGMVFSVDERVVRKYLKGKKEIDSGDVTWNMRKASETAG